MNITKEQKTIIEARDQHIAVIASAGSGKTVTMVHKVAHMLKHNEVVPERLLMTSFSRLANEELTDKLSKLVDLTILNKVTIKTIHALAYEYVAKYRDRLGIDRIYVVDTSYYAGIIKNLIKYPPKDTFLEQSLFEDNIKEAKAMEIAKKFHTFKHNNASQGIMPSDHTKLFDCKVSIKLLFELTEKRMRKSNHVTFSDLQIFFLYLLNSQEDVVEEVRKRFDCMIVDECLPYGVPILLEDGTSLPIGEIVENKMGVKVLTYNEATKNQEACRITKWSKTPNTKKMVKINLQTIVKKSNGNFYTNSIVCTVDHKIFTYNRGWIEAGDIVEGDLCQIETEAYKTKKYKMAGKGRNTLSEDKLPIETNCPVVAKAVQVQSSFINDCYVYDITVEKNHNFYANGVLVHNCQDTSEIQFELLDRFVDTQTKTVVVGDARQIVFSFAGSHYSHWDSFMKKYESKIYRLSETFRFGQKIVDLSNNISNAMKIPEYFLGDTVTNVETDNDIIVDVSHFNHGSRVKTICNDIERKVENGFDYKDLHIMYRTNKESRGFEKELIRRKIPHRVLKGSFLDRREIKFLLNTLRVFDSFSREVLISIMKEYSNFIDYKTLWWVEQSLLRKKDQKEITVTNFLSHAFMFTIQGVGLKRKQEFRELYEQFSVVDNLIKDLDLTSRDSKEGFIEKLASEMNISDTKFMMGETSDTGEDTYSERMAFVNRLSELFTITKFDSIEAFINDLKINFNTEERDSDDEFNGVTLRTIHKSKGATLPVVYLIEDYIGGWRKDMIEDEKFVYYVAVTRSSKHLYMFHNSLAKFCFIDFVPKKGIMYITPDEKTYDISNIRPAGWSNRQY